MSVSPDRGLVGRTVVDLRHEPIGKVVDIIFEEDSDDPRYAVVGTGLLRTERYVPIGEFSRTGDGRIVVPFDAERVKHAPKANKAHIVTPEVEEEMVSHYGADESA